MWTVREATVLVWEGVRITGDASREVRAGAQDFDPLLSASVCAQRRGQH